MNKNRRNRIAQALESLRPIVSDLESILDEEQEAFDNMPVSLQEGERGEQSSTAIDALESATSEINSAIEALEGIE